MEFEIETVINIGSDEFYRAARYQTPLSVMLINSKDKNTFDIVETILRPTDIIQQLNSELVVVFLSHTTLENAKIFIDNIQERFSFTYTIDAYKGFKVEFIQNIFIQNQKFTES